MSRTNLSIPSLKVLSELITKGCATLWSNKSQSMASDSSPMISSSSGTSEPLLRSSPSLPAPLSCSEVLQSSSSCGSEWLGPRCHHHDIHAASIWSVSCSSPDGGSSRWSLSLVTRSRLSLRAPELRGPQRTCPIQDWNWWHIHYDVLGIPRKALAVFLPAWGRHEGCMWLWIQVKVICRVWEWWGNCEPGGGAHTHICKVGACYNRRKRQAPGQSCCQGL